MESVIAKIRLMAEQCECGQAHVEIPIEKIVVANGALGQVGAYLEEKSLKKAAILADQHTYKAAGEALVKQLEQTQIEATVIRIQPDENGDVVADEKALVQALLNISDDTDVLLSVGAGTIHDITRFCGAKMKIPFISIPTAPSVDGFTSLGAPLIVNGVKKTFQMMAPIAVFADLAILTRAPRKMIAAGFGDMVAKITSLADWRFGHLIAGEPYCPLVAQMTKEALESCVSHYHQIAKGEETGIQLLIEALIESGLAMLLFGQSHPASGGEHHLSHYWEMEFIKKKQKAVLHGAKVGVSTALLSEIYKDDFLKMIEDEKELERLNHGVHKDIIENLKEHRGEIQQLFRNIPDSDQIRQWVETIGGESLPEQLGISQELLNRSLVEAHNLRDRLTALKFLNEVAEYPLVRV